MDTIQVDLTPYIENEGFINVEAFLNKMGFEKKEEVFLARIDTVAIAQILKISTRTLSRYIKSGFITLDYDKRLSLEDALKLKQEFPELKTRARKRAPYSPRRQIRTINHK